MRFETSEKRIKTSDEETKKLGVRSVKVCNNGVNGANCIDESMQKKERAQT